MSGDAFSRNPARLQMCRQSSVSIGNFGEEGKNEEDGWTSHLLSGGLGHTLVRVAGSRDTKWPPAVSVGLRG